MKTAPAERFGAVGGTDPDGDGIAGEIVEGRVAVLMLFLANQEVPHIEPPADPAGALLWAEGGRAREALANGRFDRGGPGPKGVVSP